MDKKTVWNCDIICKVAKPDQSEIKLLRNTKLLVAYLNPHFEAEVIRDLAQVPNLTSLALEAVPRITRAQKLDALSS